MVNDSPVSVNIMSVPAGAAIEVNGALVVSRVAVQKIKSQGCGCQSKRVLVW